jgi:hypothetical protein
MFKFKVDNQVIKRAKELVSKFNFGQRHTANGTKEQQVVGLIGEIMIRDLFNAGDIDGNNGFDGGYDLEYFGKFIDVKTMGRTTDPKPDFVNNLIELQINHKADYFIFNSLNKKSKELTVCGWISKKDFIKLADHFPKGSIRKRKDGTSFKTFSGLYELKNNYLKTTNSPQQLLKQLL